MFCRALLQSTLTSRRTQAERKIAAHLVWIYTSGFASSSYRRCSPRPKGRSMTNMDTKTITKYDFLRDPEQIINEVHDQGLQLTITGDNTPMVVFAEQNFRYAWNIIGRDVIATSCSLT